MQLVFFFGGVFLLLLCSADLSLAQAGYDEEKFGVVCDSVFQYLEGGFGALLAAVAGMGAIIASAAGGFRVAWALIVVSIGAFIIREYNGLFFPGGCG